MRPATTRLEITNPAEHRRRLNALQTAAKHGWGAAETAAHLGITRDALSGWAKTHRLSVPWLGRPYTSRHSLVDTAAQARLAAQIRALQERGRDVPCAGSPLPTSDRSDDRGFAARVLCARCPVRRACAAAGRGESFGVWGGRDRGPVAEREKADSTTTRGRAA